MSTTSDKTNSSESAFDQVLNETDIGRFIGKNKLMLAVLLIVILGAVIGQGVYNNVSAKKRGEFSDRVYSFKQGPLKEFTEKKLTPEQIFSEYKNLMTEVGGFAGAGPITFSLLGEFKKQNQNDFAVNLLENANTSFQNPYVLFFVKLNLAAEYENTNKATEAIAMLESLLSHSVKIYEEKIYLDLGRLYLNQGNKSKAKSSFEYVINSGKEAEFKKLATIYMEGL